MKNKPVLPVTDTPAEGKYPNRYRPGQSGNPGGRPKKTAAELKAVEKMKKLTPEAVDVVVAILRNPKASFYARLQAAEIIFNRAMGRPETYLKVDQAEQSVQASVARLQVLFGTVEEAEENAPAQDDQEPEGTEDPEKETEDETAEGVDAAAG